VNLIAIVPIKDLKRAMLNDVLRALSNASRVNDIVIVTPSYEVMNLVSQFNKVHIVHDEGIGC